MTTESKPKLTGSLHLHVRGPVFTSAAHFEESPDKPYAVIRLGMDTETNAVIFPDAEALDSLIAGALQVRAEIRQRMATTAEEWAEIQTWDHGPVPAREEGMRVARLGDDSPCPVTAEIIHAAVDPDYVWVRWDRPGDTPGPVVREPRDDLMPYGS